MNKWTFAAILASFVTTNAGAIPINDLIDNAIALGPGAETVSGTTIDSTFDDIGFVGTSNTTGGVWYTFAGTGGAITLSTCNQANYDTKISVVTGYTGTIASLVGVAGQDDAGGCAGFTTHLDFNSALSTQYWALIHGFGSATGDFDLSFIPAEVAAVPEPTTLALFGIGLAGLGLARRRKKV